MILMGCGGGYPWSVRNAMTDLTFDQHMRRLDLMAKVSKQARGRAQEASQVIKRSAFAILGGRRTGRRYRISGTRRVYTASARGESPAWRLRKFRNSWYTNPEGISPGIDTTKSEIARIMTKGAKRGNWILHRRPFVRKIRQRSRRGLRQIYRRPYLR